MPATWDLVPGQGMISMERDLTDTTDKVFFDTHILVSDPELVNSRIRNCAPSVQTLQIANAALPSGFVFGASAARGDDFG